MKQSIKWHKDRLTNRINSLQRDKLLSEQFITKLKKGIYTATKYNIFYTKQIEAAIKEGKKDFDREKYLKPIKKKQGNKDD